jgi:hypothetical protein
MKHAKSVALVRARTSRAIHAFVRNAPPGSAQLIQAVPGAGKTRELPRAIASTEKQVRVLAPTLRRAAELTEAIVAEGVPADFIAGRSKANCEHSDRVRVASRAGFSISRDLCGPPDGPLCPFRTSCTHYRQYQGARVRVGTTEQLWNPEFMDGGELVFMDDPNWDALFRDFLIFRAELASLAVDYGATKEKMVAPVLKVLIAAIDRLEREGSSELLIGADVWDHLVVTGAELGIPWLHAVRQLAKAGRLAMKRGPATADGDELDSNRNLAPLFTVLQREAEKFATNREFNSQLAINRSSLQLRWIGRTPTDPTVLPVDVAVCVLDATPNELLCDRLFEGFHRADDVFCTSSASEKVVVTQHVDFSIGHRSIREAGMRDRVREITRQIASASPSGATAAITYKEHEEELKSMGVEGLNVITWPHAKGTNEFIECGVLLTFGRPQPPEDWLLYLTMAADPDGPPVIRDWELKWRAFEGQQYQAAYFDFRDRRAAQMLHWHRESTVFQGVHRSRLAVRDEPLEVHLFTPLPIPGITVTKLEGFPTRDKASRNDETSADAVRRIREAAEALQLRGEVATARKIMEIARCGPSTALKYRHLWR